MAVAETPGTALGDRAPRQPARGRARRRGEARQRRRRGPLGRCGRRLGAIVADAGTDLYNPNAIRASLGTIFHLPLAAATAETRSPGFAARASPSSPRE